MASSQGATAREFQLISARLSQAVEALRARDREVSHLRGELAKAHAIIKAERQERQRLDAECEAADARQLLDRAALQPGESFDVDAWRAAQLAGPFGRRAPMPQGVRFVAVELPPQPEPEPEPQPHDNPAYVATLKPRPLPRELG